MEMLMLLLILWYNHTMIGWNWYGYSVFIYGFHAIEVKWKIRTRDLWEENEIIKLVTVGKEYEFDSVAEKATFYNRTMILNSS